MESPIKPYKIEVPESKLESLEAKLDLATFPNDAPHTDKWTYGAPLGDIKRLVKHWRNDYDWRAHEAKLNELPHFTTRVPVDGFGELDMHFVHQKSTSPDAVPLLFCHGWPGSFIEATKVLPLLTSEKDGLAFHVVVPSLPNYAFSDAVGQPGFAPPQYAESLHKIMLKLGYDKYVTQGGDWGYMITRYLGLRYPQHVLASHWNNMYANPPTFLKHPVLALQSLLPEPTPEANLRRRGDWFANEGYGYNLLQATKPATIGYALHDSPVGLLAWIYEKLHDWTDAYPWTDDEVLTWISIYLFSKAGPDASSRIYYERKHMDPAEVQRALSWHGDVKLGWSTFPQDLHPPPSAWGHTLGPIVLEKKHPNGGHFAAWERPEVLVGDVREMFGPGGPAEDVIKDIRKSKK